MSAANIPIRTIAMLDDDGSTDKPHLPKYLFWEVCHEKMEWRKASRFVIERILDWGGVEELSEIIRFYGRRRVLHVLKNVPIYLMDHSIERACTYFKLKPEELRCYTRKQSRKGHWP